VQGRIDCGKHRRDLRRGREKQHNSDVEAILQVMWPSDKVKGLREGVLHQRGLALAKAVLGDDAAFDFDMIM
jgi:hypothetical protein